MNYIHYVRNLVTPVLQTSNFESGILTPTEFIEAGDFLVYKCPTWEWSAGDIKKRKKYLPPDKQYLVTRNVPCLQRCSASNCTDNIMQDGDWTVFTTENNENDDLEDKYFDVETSLDVNVISHEVDDENEDDLAGNYSNIIRTRTYNVYITYDNYYRTPRVWLFGYNESGNPLSNVDIFDDVSPDHAKKTVTYESHPHEKYMALSVHPCQHANVMKKLIAQSRTHIVRPDQYLCLFLKFIGTVIPTIQYDFSLTM